MTSTAAIAQLGERQTEDLKVPGSIPGVGILQQSLLVGDDAQMTPVGFEPTQLALVELESTPLDHWGKVSCSLRLKAVLLKLTTKMNHRRAAPGIEPATSRTLSENPATRLSSHVLLLRASLSAAADVRNRSLDPLRGRQVSSRL